MNRVKLYCVVLTAIFCSAFSAQKKNSDFSLVEECNAFDLLQGKISGVSKGRSYGYVKGDFLYFVPFEEGLEYAYRQDSTEDTGLVTDLTEIPVTVNGRFQRVDWKWLPGFRLEAGGHLPLDDWYAYAKWTRIVGDLSGSSSIESIETNDLAAIWLGAGSSLDGYEQATQARGTWNLNYNVLNLALFRQYFSSSHLVLSVHSGLQGAWINQQFRADYSGGTIAIVPIYFKAKNNFQAAGLFGQGEMSWMVTKHWKIMSGLSGSVNFGRYKLHQQILAAVNDGVLSLPYGLRDVLSQIEYRTRFAYEATFGVEWNYVFKDDVSMSLNAMYNLVEWIDLNQLRRFTFSNGFEDRYFYSTNGNLGFQGISVSLGLGY